MVEAAIGLGSNIGDKAGNIDRAVTALDTADGVRVVARSAYYRTAPWGVTDQDWFVNGCVVVKTELDARDLLALCLDVEQRLGRKRDRHWGPRIIDLDILTYGDAVIDEPGLTVPHPHMLDRVFVLAPLAELMPEKIVSGIRVADALARLDDSGVHRLDVVEPAE